MKNLKKDITGFPLLYIPPLSMWLQTFPISKVQFEVFLSQSRDYQNADYERILAQNPRVSFRHFHANNYEGLFLTGISVSVVQKYLMWCGNDYLLPTNLQWKIAYSWLSAQPACQFPEKLSEYSEIVQLIWQGIFQIRRPKNLAEQLLMQYGVMEWVIDRDTVPKNGYGGMGQPRPSFWNVLHHPTDAPIRPINDLKSFGFRLLWSEK